MTGYPPAGEDDYAVLDVVGEPSHLENPKDHLELGESLGLIDTGSAAPRCRVHGSHFLTGRGALLQLDCQLALKLAVD